MYQIASNKLVREDTPKFSEFIGKYIKWESLTCKMWRINLIGGSIL